MKVGVITFLTTLLLALPAFAGPTDECAGGGTGPDFDLDGWVDLCDNCDALPNASQLDGDSDGYGNVCDCDFDNNGACDGGDFTAFNGVFGTLSPPTSSEFDMAPNGAIDGGDFTAFVGGFGGFPGPACGNGVGGPGC
jgi:hypothetical protein